MSEIKDLTKEIVEWADSVFPDRGPQAALLKLFEETGELVKNPKSPGEYADICIMLFDLANMNGIDLSSAIKDKLQINKRRTWEKSLTGTLQHTIFPDFEPSELLRLSEIAKNLYEIGKRDFRMGKAQKTFKDFSCIKEYEWYLNGYRMGDGDND